MEKILFHLMAEKMRELAVDGKLVPDDEDLSTLLMVLSLHVKGSDLAGTAFGVASGELCNDLGYHINERYDCIRFLLDALVADGILEELCGDNHTAYILEG